MGGFPGGMHFNMGGPGGQIDPNEIFKMFFSGGMGGGHDMGGGFPGFSFGGMPGQGQQR